MGRNPRGHVIVALVVGTLLAPVTIEAQPSGKVVIGVLAQSSRSAFAVYMDAFRQALRDRGYVGALSITFEERWAEGRIDRLPELAAELVRLKVDVIAAETTPAVVATKRATREIPIVFIGAGDPVGNKLVDSLARPGGNVTGLSIMNQELGPKRLELIKQTLPKADGVAFLSNLANPAAAANAKTMEHAARSLKLDLRVFDVRRTDEVETAVADMAKQRIGAVIIGAEPTVTSQLPRLFRLTMKYRLPALLSATYAQNDFFMAFGFDQIEQWRRAAVYVDRILKGARPADLPVEQLTKFRLVVNLKTAKALGVTIPPAVLLQADEIVR